MKTESYYCDRCGAEIKYHLPKDFFPYMDFTSAVFENVHTDGKDKVSAYVRRNKEEYELCHKCKKAFRRWIKNED